MAKNFPKNRLVTKACRIHADAHDVVRRRAWFFLRLGDGADGAFLQRKQMIRRTLPREVVIRRIQ